MKQSKPFHFKIGLIAAGVISLALGISFITSANNGHFFRDAKADSFSFLFNKDNAPTLTGADKEQKEVVATGLNNKLFLTYSHASNSSYAHAVLSNGGYIANYQSINDMKSLVVTGSGSFRLGYGIEAITNYVNLNLDESSYTLEDVSMNYFKLVAASDNATVVSISGTDTCASAAEYGVSEYSNDGGTYTNKWTRLIHDVPATQAFTFNVSWTQTEVAASNTNNPRIFLIDADALYNADDSYVVVSETNAGFGCRGLQFRQDWNVDNYKTAATKGNNVSSNSVAGASKAGVAGAFVDASGTIFTTGFVDDASGKVVGTNEGQAGLGWSKLRVGGLVTANITYTPDPEGLNELRIVWNIKNTIDDVAWSFTMTQRARFNNIPNLAMAIGSAKCNWEIHSVSSTGLH